MVEVSTRIDPQLEADAEGALDAQRVQAGKEYLDALHRLGLEPDVLCWVYDAIDNEIELAIVTSMAERVESLQIYRLLFRAYEAAATPREIDPFIVSIYGSNSFFGITLRENISDLTADGAFSSPENAKRFVTVIQGSAGFKVVLARGVYARKELRRSAAEDLRRWGRFKQNVEAVAA